MTADRSRRVPGNGQPALALVSWLCHPLHRQVVALYPTETNVKWGERRMNDLAPGTRRVILMRDRA